MSTFRDIFRAHARFVGRSLYALGLPDQDVDDAVQEVFIVAAKRIGEYEERGSIRSWLYAICLFVARRSRRDAVKGKRLDPLDEQAPTAAPDPEQAVGGRMAVEQAVRVLDTLSEEQREAFVLYEIEELTLREVADALGCPLQTAYSRVHVARRRLRLALETRATAESRLS